MPHDQATLGQLKEILHRRSRHERTAHLSPTQRMTLDRIRKLREAMGPPEFDIASAVRELRNNG